MYKSIKRHVYEALEGQDVIRPVQIVVRSTIMALIFLNVVAVILASVKSLSEQYGSFFYTFEVVSVVIFTLEYLARVWTATADDRYSGSITGRLKFIFTPMAIIDLLAILPFYVPALIPIDLRFVRVLRLVRLTRILKIARYSESVRVLGRVFKAKRGELGVTVFVIGLLLVITASLMYHVENTAQPEVFSSIPAAMWWAVATLTTVGYGDVYPVTDFGKFLGAIIALLGIGLFALPTGILASGFAEAISPDKPIKKCPHCGREIQD